MLATKICFLGSRHHFNLQEQNDLLLLIQVKAPSHSFHMFVGEQWIIFALISLFVEFGCMSRVSNGLNCQLHDSWSCYVEPRD